MASYAAGMDPQTQKYLQGKYDPRTGGSVQSPGWRGTSPANPNIASGGGSVAPGGFGGGFGNLGSSIANAATSATKLATGATPSSAMGAPAMAPTPAGPSGTESGPGILEQWFNSRASGTDPGYEYATKRGLTNLDNRYSAAGSFNSGAARQGEGDFMANMASQREGQLDSLAGGASGEHQGRLNSMFNQGLGIAGGQAGLASGYDLGAGGAMSEANKGALMLALQKAGVDSQAAQGFINNVFGGITALNSGGKK